MKLPTIQNPTPTICRKLRTKNYFGTFGDDEPPWHSNGSTTAVYWCLGTMETAGPDDQLCHPTTCLAGRTCFDAGKE